MIVPDCRDPPATLSTDQTTDARAAADGELLRLRPASSTAVCGVIAKPAPVPVKRDRVRRSRSVVAMISDRRSAPAARRRERHVDRAARAGADERAARVGLGEVGGLRPADRRCSMIVRATVAGVGHASRPAGCWSCRSAGCRSRCWSVLRLTTGNEPLDRRRHVRLNLCRASARRCRRGPRRSCPGSTGRRCCRRRSAADWSTSTIVPVLRRARRPACR